MNKTIQWIIGVVAVVALLLSLKGLIGGNNQSAVSLGAGTRFPNGISANSTSPSAGQVLGTTLLTSAGGTVNQQTTNAATSTAKLGCIQTTATSTASPIIITYSQTFVGTTTLPTGLANAQGVVTWKFGSCPQ